MWFEVRFEMKQKLKPNLFQSMLNLVPQTFEMACFRRRHCSVSPQSKRLSVYKLWQKLTIRKFSNEIDDQFFCEIIFSLDFFSLEMSNKQILLIFK